MNRNLSYSTLLLAFCFSLVTLFPTTSVLAASKTDINSATVEQLEAVKGIGHDTAMKILAYKEEHGKFTSMTQLEAVSGVGKVRLEALNEVFTVGPGKKGHKKTSMK